MFEAISRSEISRINAERRLGEELSFGDMLLRLRQYGLPRFKGDPESPWVCPIQELASLGPRAG